MLLSLYDIISKLILTIVATQDRICLILLSITSNVKVPSTLIKVDLMKRRILTETEHAWSVDRIIPNEPLLYRPLLLNEAFTYRRYKCY